MRGGRERAVKLKLNRGHAHRDDVLGRIQAFWKASPPQIERRDDSTTRQRNWVVRLSTSPPVEDWALIVGDAIHNLRAALDHLVWQLVETNRKTPGRHNSFPIAEDESRFRSMVEQSLLGVDAPAAAAIQAIKPWKGESEALWLLHQLDIQDKHRLPLVALASNEAVSLDFGKMMEATFPALGAVPSMRIGLRPSDRDVADGTVLLSEKLDDPRTHKSGPEFHFEIDLNLPDGTRRPLGNVLAELASAADTTIGTLTPFLA